MMYTDVVRRTQVYLEDEEAGLLEQAAARTGASRSELIRRAIRTQYGAQTAQARLAGLRVSAGMWRDRPGTGADYVEEERGDLNQRFEELGLR